MNLEIFMYGFGVHLISFASAWWIQNSIRREYMRDEMTGWVMAYTLLGIGAMIMFLLMFWMGR